MKKLEMYDGNKSYMFPNGALATKEAVLKQFPACLTFTHVVETDNDGEMMFAMMNLSALRSIHNVDTSLSKDNAVIKIQEILNVVVIQEPTTEERMVAAVEFQNLLALPDVEVV